MKAFVVVAVLAIAANTSAAPGVVGSAHDLSSTGRGGSRAPSERDPCIFCHVSHMGGVRGTNRPDPAGGYVPYKSSTMTAGAGEPTGASRVCLSCHDGTIALGQTLTRTIELTGPGVIQRGSKGYIGTDLRGSHPISFSPREGAAHRRPDRHTGVALDAKGQVQCTSCHDPHSERGGDPAVGKFLVKPLSRSQLCTTCHTLAQGVSSSHEVSTVPVRDQEGRATTTADMGCTACHATHGADPGGRLLKPGSTDDEPCMSCHSGGSAAGDVARDLAKQWAHLSDGRGAHDAAEQPDGASARRLPETSVGARRHVACADCHEPHSSNRDPATAPAVQGALKGVWGISIDGHAASPAQYEYEVCLKCHGDSANKPQGRSGFTSGARRALPDANLRLVFGPDAISSHPVAGPIRGAAVPSLLAPWKHGGLIYCTDCHGSNDSSAAGAAGARGPHGSIYPYLLERDYQTSDLTPESPAAYALCYKCHDRELLLSERSTFPGHRKHVVDSRTPCSACHDAHGVSRDAGRDSENLHLISFDRAIVKPLGTLAPAYSSLGGGKGSCALSCHGVDHTSHSY